MKHCLTYFVATLLLALPVSLYGQSAVIDQVIARVGGEYILLSQLEEQFALTASQSNTPIPPEARCQMLDQLLVGKLLYNQSKLDSLEVGDGEVEQQLNARIERILGYMGGSIEQFEDYYGQTITATKEQFREDLREQLAVDRMRASVVQQVKVTPAEVMTFFNEIPRDSLPYFNSEVEVGEIVAMPEPNEQTKQITISRLEEIREMIVSEAISFEDAARKYSTDGSARGGGDLGWTKRGKFVPEFEAAAYNLEPGEMSGIVESEFGFHLIKLQERRGNSIRVSHILLRAPVLEEDVEESTMYLDSIANLIRVDSFSFSFAVKQFGFDKVQSYNNDGRMSNPASGNTFFEIGDLDPDIYFTIDEMEVGDVSEPLEYKGPRGEQMLRIIQLQSRTAPHQATLKLDYAKIQDAAKQAKQQQFLSDWIEETIGKTFVKIDDRYRPCPAVQNWLNDSRKITTGKDGDTIITGEK